MKSRTKKGRQGDAETKVPRMKPNLANERSSEALSLSGCDICIPDSKHLSEHSTGGKGL